MNVLGFTIVNSEKWDRALHGTIQREGRLSGGVGDNASDEAKIAEYDRLGGLILKGKNKVQMGCFYDFAQKKPKTKPEVVLVFRDIDGDEVLVGEDEEIPLEVKAAEIAKAKKGKKKVKKTIEDEEN